MGSAKPVRVPDLRAMKRQGRKIAMLTAYDAPTARLLDQAGIDVLLVGDSVGMVVLGYDTTIPVTIDAMVHHAQAVSRGARRALLVADMPFLSYQVSVEEAIRNAGRLLQEGGAHAVKLEGGTAWVCGVVERLVEAGVPVMGHLGLTPQAVHQLGGFRRQAKSEPDAGRLLEQARQLEASGAFAVVLESIPDDVAARVTEALGIPTIGIGAGPHCDGQVLVAHDVLGLTGNDPPPFARQYAALGPVIVAAARQYIEEVRGQVFPPRGQTETPGRENGQ
jgi:3-methyl-2-oxobutanoate hydroxymethyltransferase